jgi:hypothetical protein
VGTNDTVGLIILSLFCAGGLYAYAREARRLQRLISSGTVAQALVVKKEKIDSGSESVMHFLVTYEFVDDRGNTIVHEQDLNSGRFFNRLSVGDKIEILYQGGPAMKNSYPLSRIRADRKTTHWIIAAIILFWTVVGAILMI